MADESMNLSVLPPEVQAKLDRHEPMKVMCPAGEPVRDRRNGRQGVMCKIEDEILTLQNSPLAVACLCCYQYGECPSWQADQDDDPVVARQREAKERRKQERQTERHVETGMRVDDREERETEKWLEDEIKLQSDPGYAHEEDARGQSQIALPPGVDITGPTKKSEE